MRATLTQQVQRPNTIPERQANFQEWLLKVRSNFYAQRLRVLDACENIE